MQFSRLRIAGTGLLGATLVAPALLHAQTAALTAEDYRADAVSLTGIIRENYAYLDELPGGTLPASAQLDAERDAVHNDASLLRYAEDVIASLADHHALTGRSFGDDWAIVPSYADIWLVRSGDAYRVDAVREGSIAEGAGIRPGFRLASIGGVPVDAAIADFWARIGLQPAGERGAYAARVLAAGRRDRQRVLGFVTPQGARSFTLDNLYSHQSALPAITVATAGGITRIRFNNSLGDMATIAAFDTEMAKLPLAAPVVLDLTDTPSGGTTSVARGIMGWFVRKPMPYQVHRLPSEERETGIARQWVEYVLPRSGKYHSGPVQIRVGRWTGSMGEGLAAAFMAFGKPACGTAMAGLKGAIYDFDLPKSGLRIKLPAERLSTIAGQARHEIVPKPCA